MSSQFAETFLIESFHPIVRCYGYQSPNEVVSLLFRSGFDFSFMILGDVLVDYYKGRIKINWSSANSSSVGAAPAIAHLQKLQLAVALAQFLESCIAEQMVPPEDL